MVHEVCSTSIIDQHVTLNRAGEQILPDTDNIDADYFLDISDEICPMTFVKAKLLIERMTVGETARIRLQGVEPLDNVPRSIKDYGHEILSIEGETAEAPSDGIHLLIFRKNQ